MEVTIIADNGHAWGIVSVEQLKAARLSPSDFTRAMTKKTPHGLIYALEEDCDLPKYLKKLDSMGIRYKLRDTYIPDRNHPENPRTW